MKQKHLLEETTKSLIFVCTINRHRSVIAEYLFRDLIEKTKTDQVFNMNISSVGIVTQQQKMDLKKEGIALPRPLYGYRPMPCVILYMQKEGLDTSCHRSKALTRKWVKDASLIIGMGESHKTRVLGSYPDAKGKTVTLAELSWPFEFKDIVNEPPGLMPPNKFCMLNCDHWAVTEALIKEVKDRRETAMKNIVSRLA